MTFIIRRIVVVVVPVLSSDEATSELRMRHVDTRIDASDYNVGAASGIPFDVVLVRVIGRGIRYRQRLTFAGAARELHVETARIVERPQSRINCVSCTQIVRLGILDAIVILERIRIRMLGACGTAHHHESILVSVLTNGESVRFRDFDVARSTLELHDELAGHHLVRPAAIRG